jgi:hypothetical protein
MDEAADRIVTQLETASSLPLCDTSESDTIWRHQSTLPERADLRISLG